MFKRLENETRRLATTAWRVRLGGGPAAAEQEVFGMARRHEVSLTALLTFFIFAWPQTAAADRPSHRLTCAARRGSG